MGLKKIISGGQTGADQGALDAAIEAGVPYGGAIPAGRRTEVGPLPESYLMSVLASASYPERTRSNVEAADGTLILSHGPLSGGSALTWRLAVELGKPALHLDLDHHDPGSAAAAAAGWIELHSIEVVNVAGPRASSDPRIYRRTRATLSILLGDIERSND